MRHGYIILLATVLLLAASLVAVGTALGANTTAMPSPGQAPQSSEPYKVWPLPVAGMPAASSPAVQLPTATPTMKPTAPVATGEGADGGYTAKVIDKGLVSKTVSPGSTITGYAVIQNTGKDMIKDALLHLDVMRTRENAHSIKVATLDLPLSNLYIAPGDQKRADFSINLPGSATAGSYIVQGTVEANSQQADTFRLPVTVR